MAVIRWRFTDPVTLDTYTVPINPNEMSTPYPTKARQHQSAGPNVGGSALVRGTYILTLQAPTVPSEWTFAGVIRTQAHYEALLAWAEKDYPVQIRDHYERTWEVLITAFDPEDRRPTPTVPWRLRYTMRTLMLGPAL